MTITNANSIRRTITRVGALTLTTAVMTLSACGSDDASTRPSSLSTTESTDRTDASTVTVEAVDYGFNGVPSSVPSGTTFALRNSAPTELHEMVAFRLSDGDDMALSEIVQLPADELVARMGAPAVVILQAPGSDEEIVAVGDGVLREPGRYVLMCFIPTGVDPQDYLAAAAASNGGPPTGVAGGPPHFVNGMYAEFRVQPDA